MPTYQYRCADCENEFEIVQKFSDAALTTCPECEGPLRKVFSPVGVVFKGSGFYATDNRTKGKSNAAKPSEAKSEGGAETSSPAPANTTPAPATPASSGSGSSSSSAAAPAS